LTTRRTKGRSREEKVLDAAAEAIAALGLAQVRMSDVAERAGMTTGHVTYYFPSKNDLLMRAIRRSEAVLTEQAATELAGIDDPWQRLDRLVQLSAAQGAGDPGWVLWFHVWATAAADPEVARVHDELDGAWRAILVDVIEYGCGRGDFVTDDADAAALQLSAVVDGLSTQLALGSTAVTRARLLQLARHTAELLLAP
jgi:AcrR family transcriptional regulator